MTPKIEKIVPKIVKNDLKKRKNRVQKRKNRVQNRVFRPLFTLYALSPFWLPRIRGIFSWFFVILGVFFQNRPGTCYPRETEKTRKFGRQNEGPKSSFLTPPQISPERKNRLLGTIFLARPAVLDFLPTARARGEKKWKNGRFVKGQQYSPPANRFHHRPTDFHHRPTDFSLRGAKNPWPVMKNSVAGHEILLPWWNKNSRTGQKNFVRTNNLFGKIIFQRKLFPGKNIFGRK